MRRFSPEEALWAQESEETIQDAIMEYIGRQNGGLNPEAFNWRWSITYTGDLPTYEGKTVAMLTDEVQDGHNYVLYQEAQGCTLTDRANSDGLDATEIASCGDALVDALPGDALVFTAHADKDGFLRKH